MKGFRPKTIVTVDEKNERKTKKEQENKNEHKPKKKSSCLKYYDKNPDNFKTQNLSCGDRHWDGRFDSFDDIHEYKPNNMDKYINKYFENNNFKNNNSPFEFQQNYKLKTSNEICDNNNFNLAPQQKFMGQFISNETDFPSKRACSLLIGVILGVLDATIL